MNKVSTLRRAAFDPEVEERAAKERAALEASASEVELSEDEHDTFFPPLVEEVPTFVNSVPKVRTDLVVKPKGLPPVSWDLLPIASLK